MTHQRRYASLLFILSLVGIALTALLIKSKYFAEETFCLVGGNCELVINSIYSKIAGVPITILGLIWFLVVLFLSFRLIKHKDKVFSKYLFYWSILGLGFVAYLLFIEIVLLEVFCTTCTAIHILIVLIFLLTFLIFRR